jgi:hypothetical protein
LNWSAIGTPSGWYPDFTLSGDGVCKKNTGSIGVFCCLKLLDFHLLRHADDLPINLSLIDAEGV